MTPTQLEAILAEREACAVVAGKLVRFDRKGADAQQRARADAFQSGQRYAAEQIRNRPTPASEEVGDLTSIAERLCNNLDAREIADQLKWPLFADSSQLVQAYWLALASTLARP